MAAIAIEVPGIYPFESLMSLDVAPPCHAVEGLVNEGQNAIFAGYFGVGKTMFAGQLSISLATARPFLGRGVRRRYRTVFMDFETGPGAIQQRLAKQVEAMHLNEEERAALAENWRLCVFGKTGDSFVFTRSDGKPVRDFRGTWAKACKDAGVPGLLIHDLRRTAARNLRRAGVAEGVIMKIGGWRTRSVFERYAIVSQADIAEALGRLELRDGHSFGHSEPTEANPDEPATA
ncbi:MAG: AAA family ATPase [Terriglobales bacterium]|jgi:integrase